MVPQLDSVIEFSSNDNCKLDPIIKFSCDTIQLRYYNFAACNNDLSLINSLNKQEATFGF